MRVYLDKQAQVTLETALVIIVLILFVLGAVRVMVWFGDNMAARSSTYKLTRQLAIANPRLGATDMIYQSRPLSLFKE